MTNKTKYIAHSALIGAMYIVLTLISSALGLASGAIQIRLSEALCVLPFFTPAAISGLFAGCLISNIITGCAIPDVIFGSLATLLGAFITYQCGKLPFKKKEYLAPVGPIVANTAIIPVILAYVYGLKTALILLVLSVGAGEIISCAILGMFLLKLLKKHNIFQ